MKNEIKLTILMPCLNESESLPLCIKKAFIFLEKNNIDGEVLIADNGSTDGSQNIALQMGARVVSVKKKGYGNALFHGIKSAKGDFIIMADSDNSYDFSNLLPFYNAYNEGFEFVIGNRFRGGIEPGAMPWKNKYIGNPILSYIGRSLFNVNIGDFHCGLRGITKSAFKKLDLRTSGMEFASEMVIKAALKKIKIKEVAIKLFPDSRKREPHLRPWRDGWRHLKFMCIFCPEKVFIGMGFLSTFIFITFYIYQINFNSQSFGALSHLVLSIIFSFNYLLLLTGIFIKFFMNFTGLNKIKGYSYFGVRLSQTAEIAFLSHFILFCISIFLFFRLFNLWVENGFYFDINSHLNLIFFFSTTFIFSMLGLSFSFLLTIFNLPLKR